MSPIPLQLLLLLKFKLSYLCPVGASSSSLLRPLDMTPAIFNSSLAIWTDKMFQDPFVHFLTLTWNQLLLPELCSFQWGIGISRPQCGDQGLSLFLGHCMHVPTHLPVCIYAMLGGILLLRDKKMTELEQPIIIYLIYPTLNLHQHWNNNTIATDMIAEYAPSACAPRSTSPFFHILYSPPFNLHFDSVSLQFTVLYVTASLVILIVSRSFIPQEGLMGTIRQVPLCNRLSLLFMLKRLGNYILSSHIFPLRILNILLHFF